MNYIEELSKYMSESKLLPLWKKYKDDVCVAPAAVTYHHNFEGGLVRHIVEMIKFGLPIALGIKEGADSADAVTEGKISFDDFIKGQATLIDADEFINVCFLHDLAKLQFYKKDGDGSIYSYVKHENVLQEMVVQNMCASVGVTLTESEINALWLAEGGYSPLFKELKASPLAILVHMADLFSSQLLQPKKVINAACPSCDSGTLVQGKDFTVIDTIPQKEADKISKTYKEISEKFAEELKMPRYWYKFQAYNPRDPWSDGLGYVHLKSKKSYEFYVSRLEGLRRLIAEYKRNYKKIVKLKGRSAYITGLRELNDRLENIPHSYGRKEYTGERKA